MCTGVERTWSVLHVCPSLDAAAVAVLPTLTRLHAQPMIYITPGWLVAHNGCTIHPAPQLKEIMLRLGEKLSDEDVAEIFADAHCTHKGHITFLDFKLLIHNKVASA